MPYDGPGPIFIHDSLKNFFKIIYIIVYLLFPLYLILLHFDSLLISSNEWAKPMTWFSLQLTNDFNCWYLYILLSPFIFLFLLFSISLNFIIPSFSFSILLGVFSQVTILYFGFTSLYFLFAYLSYIFLYMKSFFVLIYLNDIKALMLTTDKCLVHF